MKQELNIIMRGMSGKCGPFVYYQRHGKTFVRKAPGSYNKEATPDQAIVRKQFLKANEYARSVMQDPLLKAKYLALAKRKYDGHIYNTAVADYFKQLKEE